ncbi:hypothetical protein [Paenibacillus puerhi]|uniref:hypothetical protein n=1 Tax=Paenibacillus puerhi TaxID=2692622 RepID=UPI001358C0C2|nr:hypothetical protein [Paenibacillus puerhi]
MRLTNQTKDLQKFIKLTGGRAKLDAKANDTYIVYKTAEGQIVKEYSDGHIIPVSDQDSSHA